MTRRASVDATSNREPSGGSTPSAMPTSPATRRANLRTKPNPASPGGSVGVPKPSRPATRRAMDHAQSGVLPPGGSRDLPKPKGDATRPGGPSLRDLIREIDTDRTVPDVDLAQRLLDALGSSGQVGLLLPILTDEVRRLRRRHVAWVERQTFRDLSAGEPAEGGWLRLLPESFVLPDGRMVTWGTATVEDHEARIEWLNGQMHALAQDVDRHEQAVKLIREHGATCLAEIEAAA